MVRSTFSRAQTHCAALVFLSAWLISSLLWLSWFANCFMAQLGSVLKNDGWIKLVGVCGSFVSVQKEE